MYTTVYITLPPIGVTSYSDSGGRVTTVQLVTDTTTFCRPWTLFFNIMWPFILHVFSQLTIPVEAD